VCVIHERAAPYRAVRVTIDVVQERIDTECAVDAAAKALVAVQREITESAIAFAGVITKERLIAKGAVESASRITVQYLRTGGRIPTAGADAAAHVVVERLITSSRVVCAVEIA